jgi:hypothetical protein
LAVIRRYCEENSVEMDVRPDPATVAASPKIRSGELSGSVAKAAAFPLFARGDSIVAIAKTLERAPGTVSQYLDEYIRGNKIEVPSPWVKEDVARRVTEAAREAGIDRLKPIFEFLKGEVSYEEIRICVACLRNIAERS